MNVTKGVFPVAGLGTRFLPATKAQPKVMLPLVDKPIIHYVVDEAVQSGIEDIIFVTGRGQAAIENYFDVSFELEEFLRTKNKTDELQELNGISNLISPCYLRQKEAKGLGHAILVARHIVGSEPFAVFLGDDVIDSAVPCMRQMVDVFQRYKCSVVALQRVHPSQTSSYGIVRPRQVDERIFQVLDMVEKPDPEEAPSDLAIIGRYILTPEIFDILAETQPGKGGEIQLTDALRGLLQRQVIYGYLFEGTRYDTGDKLGFLQATVEFTLRRDDIGGAFRKYLEELICRDR
ncbi:MAG: UTP--glucose-1-phosphate uridylyltransferase GalU [Candidatus Riflebacteria bacterium]|nr:UTP--glucose-1-phosphate uridylyltransferase GalU [Candidatus Riflebacteria bacterium]